MKKVLSILLTVLMISSIFSLNISAAPDIPTVYDGIMARQFDSENNIYEFDGHLYRFYNEAITKSEAEAFCSNHGGYLLTVTGAEEQSFIEGTICRLSEKMSGYWLGISKNEDNLWQWDTSEKYDYSYWDPQCNNSVSCSNAYISSVVTMYEENYERGCHWLTDDGSSTENKIGFICEWDISYPTEYISTYNGHTYAIINNSVTWEAARTYCEFLGGHLLTITSENENQFISDFIDGQEKPFFWIGLTKSDNSWKWVTNETYSYANWAQYEPSGDGDFAHIYSRGWDSKLPGEWNDNAGNGFGAATQQITLYNYGFICEWDSDIKPIKTANSSDGTSKYAVYNIPMAWTVAENFCENLGGHLAVISSQEENDFIYSLIEEQTIKSEYWIGATDRKKEGTFEWVPYYDYVSKDTVNEPFDYINWDTDEPNNNIEYFVIGEDYVHIYQNRPTWNDQENGSDLTKHYLSEFGFICEWNTSEENFEKHITKADCETDGKTEYYSPLTDEIVKTVIIPARHHSFDDGVVTKEPNCTKEGEILFTCINMENNEYIACSYTKTEILPIEPDAHDWGEWTVITAAECERAGLERRICKNDPNHTEEREIPPLGHDWDDGVIDPASDCANHGVKKYTCQRDASHTYTEEVPLDPDNHIGSTYVKDEKAPTCLENGYTGDTYCKGCDKLLEKGEDIPATGHDWGEWKVITAAECEKAGLERRICKNDPNHTEEREIPPLGHDWDDGVIDPASDCANHGVKKYTCQRDASHTYTEEVPLDPDNHIGTTYVKDEKASTCLENGYTGDTYCKGCDKLLKKGEDISATGHDWGEWTVITAAECEKAGLERRICKNDPSHIEEREIPALGHDYVNIVTNPTCTTDGFTTHTCSRCGNSYVDSVTKALGHEYGDWYTVTEPTYTADGLEQCDCIRHDDTQTRQIPMLQKLRATFIADDKVIDVVEFEANAESIDEPAIPAKERHTGEWEDYTLGEEDIIIHAVYTPVPVDPNSDIDMEKTAEYDEATGEATIHLKAVSDAQFKTENKTVKVPLDIVLVLDQSGSMKGTRLEALQDAVSTFSNEVFNDAKTYDLDHRMAVVGFAMGNYTQDANNYPKYMNTGILTGANGFKQYDKLTLRDYNDALVNVNNNGSMNPILAKVPDLLKANGATAADCGMAMANRIFANDKDSEGRQRVIIFMTDGEPTRYSGYEESVANAALQKAELAKSAYGALVYSVNVQNDTDTSVNFMSRASSNYQGVKTMSENAVESDTKFYTLVEDTDKLKDVFNGIATSITTSYSDFDNITLIDTVSSVFTMTTEQEKALRKNAIEQLKVPDSAISVTRNNDGATTVMIEGIHPVQTTDKDGKVKYVAEISFTVTANERLIEKGTYFTNTADSGVSLDGGKTFDAVFTSPSVEVTEDTGAVIFNINGEPFHIVRVKQGEQVKAPAYDVLSGYTFSGWNIADDYTLDGGRASFDAVLSGNHKHSYKAVTLSEATCSRDGTVAYICECGDSYTEAVAKTGAHHYVAITGSAAADNYATEEFLCDTCGTSMQKTLSYKFEASVTSGRTTKKVQYDIDMLNVNGEYSQPDGIVTITVPISDYITNARSLKNVVVYRVNDDGTQVKLTAKYANGVITFETDHFCTFIFEFEYECENGEHLDEDGNGICDRCDETVSVSDPSKNCKHFCHSSNAFIKFIWKIIRFFSKIFGVNKVCSCGAMHY